jgi:hypothetical protein
MADLPRDHSHLRSGALMDIAPPGKGNSLEGRLLREHARVVFSHLERSGIEPTELHRLLVVRLGRVALQITLFERRLDKGELTADELRQYHTLNSNYLNVLRELALRPPRTQSRRSMSSSSDLDEIIAEMTQ